MSEAQRYPEDYDGILAGAPAYDRTNLHMGFVWDWLAVNKGEGGLFTKQDEEQIVKIIPNCLMIFILYPHSDS